MLYFALIILLIGHLYIFNFASDPQTNNNQTFPITSISNTSQSETIGYKGNNTAENFQTHTFVLVNRVSKSNFNSTRARSL